MTKHIIHTHLAPQAIGTYSQAVKVGRTVYLSGQIPLIPDTMTLLKAILTRKSPKFLKIYKLSHTLPVAI